MDISPIYAFFNPTATEQEKNTFLALPIDQKITRAVACFFQTIWQAVSTFFTDHQVTEQTATHSSNIKTTRVVQQKIAPKPLKNISKKTQLCLSALEQYLKKNSRTSGVAVDNGDCFYDAIGQSLQKVLQKKFTIQELRTIVHTAVQATHAQNPDNWLSKQLDKEEYEALLNTVHYAHSPSTIPLWGRPNIEGKILADHFKVTLRILEINVLDDIIPARQFKVQMVDGTPVFIDKDTQTQYDHAESQRDGTKRMIKVCTPTWVEIQPETIAVSRLVEIACYPGHFLPVFSRSR